MRHYDNGNVVKTCPIKVGEYLYTSNSELPSVTYVGTSWEQIKDKFILASGDTYTNGATGGSPDAVVVKHNHKHRQFIFNNGPIGGLHYGIGYGTGNGQAGDTEQYRDPNSEEIIFGNFETGVDGAGKNMPPYLSTYIWKRLS